MHDDVPEGDPPAPPEAARPAWLTAVCVIAILIGGLGAVGGMYGLVGVGLVSPDAMLNVQSDLRQQGMTPEQVEALEDLKRDVIDASRAGMPATVFLIPLGLGLSALVVVGGVLCLQMKETGRKLLLWSMLAAIPVDAALAAVGLVVQRKVIEVIREWTARFPQAGTVDAGRFFEILGAIGLAVVVGWLLLKVGFYVGGAAYLTRPKVRRLCRAGPVSNA